jgi:hypothetical protein
MHARLLSGLWLIITLCFAGPGLQAQIEREFRDEEGLAVIASIRGDVRITEGDELALLAQHHNTFFLSGKSLATGPDSFLVLVLSNGVTVFLGEETTLDVSVFRQRVFDAGPDDFKEEPSPSQFQARLASGRVGLRGTHLRSASSWEVETEQGTVALKAGFFTISQGSGILQLVTHQGRATYRPPRRVVGIPISEGQAVRLVGRFTSTDSLERSEPEGVERTAALRERLAFCRERIHFSTPFPALSVQWSVRPLWLHPVTEPGTREIPTNAHFYPRPAVVPAALLEAEEDEEAADEGPAG